jgi:hypothetical protein
LDATEGRTGAVFVSVRAASDAFSLAVAVNGFLLLKSSEGPLRLAVVSGVGLMLIAPLHVAEAGKRGGGISLCFGGCGADASACCVPFRGCWVLEGWAAVFESLRRQPPKLNFRLSDVPDEGVSGSVDVVESVVLLFFSGRGAAFFMFCSSTSLSLDSKSSLGRDCS